MIYDYLALYYDDFLDEELYDAYYHLISHYKKSGNIIDLGTGTAQLAIRLAQKDYFVTATDNSEKMLEIAYDNTVSANINIQFFLHDILDPLNQTYDIAIMSSDVINYLSTEAQVLKAFKNIQVALDSQSIFIFDFLKTEYITELDNYQETIDLEDETVDWQVHKTEVPFQVIHSLSFNGLVEEHLQTTYPSKVYKELLHQAGLRVVKKKILDERIIFVCKKE